MERYVQISTTTPTRELARRIARALVDRRLAACAQVVGPLESVYRWQGRIEEAKEWLCLIKTTQACRRKTVVAIESLHVYDTPEVVVTPITAGSSRYLDWLAASVRTLSEQPRSTRGSACR